MITKLGAFSEHKTGCIFRARYLEVNSGRGICAHFLAQKMRSSFVHLLSTKLGAFSEPAIKKLIAGAESAHIFWRRKCANFWCIF